MTKPKLTITTHPLIHHKLTILRDKNTNVRDFRQLCSEIANLMAFQAMSDLPLEDVEIETPVATMTSQRLSGKKLALVAILRAGLIMVDGIVTLVPSARIGHIGLYRDPESLQPVEYFSKLPADISERRIFVLDPMLATGGSAAAALQILKDKGAHNIKLLCIIAAPEGIALVHEQHPDIEIVVAAQDSHLNEHGYIVPGLGDAGDRIYGTR